MTYIKSLKLHHFRNYDQQEIHFSKKVNLFIGKNGQGKTNCLEALALLVAGRSFRSSTLKDCIQHNQSQFHIEASFVKADIEQSLNLVYSPEQKLMKHNSSTSTSFLPLIGLLNGVLFAGFYDGLIKGAPQIRRRFLDLECSQSDPIYLDHLKNFHHALKTRNLLLREHKKQMLSIYEELMANHIPYLIQKRIECLETLQHYTAPIHQKLTGLEDHIELKLSSSFLNACSSQECFEKLSEHQAKDLQLGYSMLGPHKDDVHILLNGTLAKKFGSEGQIQTLMTSIYLAEYRRLERQLSEQPLFFMDDLGQNLDEFRLRNLLNQLEQMGQVFITTPNLPNYTFQHEIAVFEVHNGYVCPLEGAIPI